MVKPNSDNTSYLIKGHRVNGILGDRLAETAVTGINQLPGVLVPTSRGVFYSEIYVLGNTEAISRRELDETTQGLVEVVTKEMADNGTDLFAVRRSLQYYQARSK